MSSNSDEYAAKKAVRRPFATVIFLMVGLTCLAYGLFSLWDWYRHTQGIGSLPVIDQTITSSTDKPDEKSVPMTSDYVVPPDQPRKITIAELGLEAYIQRVGKDQFNEIAVPSNIHFAGWYVNSPKPGDPGISIIDGHVLGRYNSAVFAKLDNLRPGNLIDIEFGDNSSRRFEVVTKSELPKREANNFLFTKHANTDTELHLITCGGIFNKKSSTYNNRVIIVAQRIK